MAFRLSDLTTLDTTQSITGTKTFTRNVTAPFFVGDGSLLTGLALTAIQVTYVQLTQLINTGGLKAGNYYLLTDFQLTHVIPNTSSTWTSPIEQLLLLASSNRTLGAQGYSVTYPSDIVYYTVTNSNLMPGSTKGFILRRWDTAQNNDIEIDFRNVRFRRWLTTLPQTSFYGDTELYIGFTDNGRPYQDFPMFDSYGQVFNNSWTTLGGSYVNIFTKMNCTFQGSIPLRNNTFINTKLLNVNVYNTFFHESTYINSALNNVNILRTGFFTYLYGNMTNSTISNRYVTESNIGYNLYATNVTTEPIAGKTLIGGKDVTVLAINSVASPTIKAAVRAGDFGGIGELQGSQPAGSVLGMKFCDNQYRYEYMNSSADTDGTSYVWVRLLKSN